MGRVHISRLLPGMVLESDVYNEADQLILPEGLKLNDKSIARLTYYGISIVNITDTQDLLEEGFEEEEEVSGENQSYSQRLKQTEEYKVFKENFEHTVGDLKTFLSDVVERNLPPDTKEIMKNINEMLHPPTGDVNVFDMMRNMRQYDDLTFVHCLNVGLICNVFGRWLGMSPEEIDIATECGIMHDIGKLKIPESIIKKPAKLTDDEYRVIKTHSTEGYNLLKNCADVNEHVKLAAYQHHEKVDGSGYPLGLTGDKMDTYAKMVAVADVYEAMTAVRIYRGSLSPFQVIEVFENEGLQKYDTKMIMTFLENIVNTYLLNRVKLSDGREGDIVFINRQKLSKPTIKCGDDFVDLSKEPNISITAIL